MEGTLNLRMMENIEMNDQWLRVNEGCILEETNSTFKNQHLKFPNLLSTDQQHSSSFLNKFG